MSNLKPIEAGCLAMIINTSKKENNGRIVKVLECFGYRHTIEGDFVLWIVDYKGPSNINGTPSNIIREGRLMRIDDPDLVKESEQYKETSYNGNSFLIK